METDFIKNFEKEVDIDGRKFKLKIFKGNEKDRLFDFMRIEKDDGRIEYSLEKRNEYYLTNCVIEAPYKWKEKAWKNLTMIERFDCLNKCILREKILLNIIKLNEGDVAKK